MLMTCTAGPQVQDALVRAEQGYAGLLCNIGKPQRCKCKNSSVRGARAGLGQEDAGHQTRGEPDLVQLEHSLVHQGDMITIMPYSPFSWASQHHPACMPWQTLRRGHVT